MNEFFISKIDDEIFSRIKGKSFKADCTLPIEDLRYLRVLHKNLIGETCAGELICNTYIAAALIDIFQKLYAANYAIEKVRLIDEYDASDELSMRDNNSSCFNFRFVSHTRRISKHGLGLAVDINPLYNPYIKFVDGKRNLEPANSEPYLDRTKDFPYKIDEQDLCYKLFTAHGFEWGGSWEEEKDWQHFVLPDDVIRILYPNC